MLSLQEGWRGLLLSLLLVWFVFAVVGVCDETASADEPNLIIRGNVIEDNGFGIYLGWFGYFVTEIADNTISANGEGIRVVNAHTAIRNNCITDNITGVRVTDTHQGEDVTEVKSVLLSQNVISGNVMYGLENLAGLTVDARCNWWGDVAGPRPPGSAEAQDVASDRITGMIDYSGWLIAPLGKSENDSVVGPTSDRGASTTPGISGTSSPEAASTQHVTTPEIVTTPQENGGDETAVSPAAQSEAHLDPAPTPISTEAVEASPTELYLFYDLETVKLYQPSAYCFCVADFNSDGATDVIMGTRYAQEVFVWLGDGSGKLNLKGNFPCDVHAQELFPADVDGDGALDVVAIGRGKEGVTLLLGDGVGGFGAVLDRAVLPSRYEVSGAALSPRVGDTSVGVVLTSKSRNSVLIYAWKIEEHSWTKESEIPVTSPRSPVVGDFNGDYYPDVALVSGAASVVVLWGAGGAWGQPDIYHQTQSALDIVSGGDVDESGCADLVFVLAGGSLGLLLGNEDGIPSYRYIGASGSDTVSQLLLDDIDGDGQLDVLALSAKTGKLAVIQGMTDGSFTEARSIPGPYSCDAVAVSSSGATIPDLIGFDRAGNRVVVFLPKGRDR